MKRLQFRWSLRTQVLTVSLIGILPLVWLRWEPWVLEKDKTDFTPHNAVKDSFNSPDGTRRLVLDVSKLRIKDIRYPEAAGPILFELNIPGMRFGHAAFKDNNTIVADVHEYLGGGMGSANIGVHYRRRFPEWWWGQLYRPEVWLFLLVLGLMLLPTRKDRINEGAEKPQAEG